MARLRWRVRVAANRLPRVLGRRRARGPARGALAGLVLAALGASGAAAQDDGLLAVFEGCVGGLVGNLEAIGSEFPGFRSGEVRLESFVAGAVHTDPAGFLASRRGAEALDDVRVACTAADDIAAVLGALRNGQSAWAGVLWQQWPPYWRPSGWRQ